MGDGGHGADVERLGVGAVHGVAGAQQAPVEVLGLASHVETLRHPRRGLGASAGTSSRRSRRRRRRRRASRGRSPRRGGGPGTRSSGTSRPTSARCVSSGVVSASSLPARSVALGDQRRDVLRAVGLGLAGVGIVLADVRGHAPLPVRRCRRQIGVSAACHRLPEDTIRRSRPTRGCRRVSGPRRSADGREPELRGSVAAASVPPAAGPPSTSSIACSCPRLPSNADPAEVVAALEQALGDARRELAVGEHRDRRRGRAGRLDDDPRRRRRPSRCRRRRRPARTRAGRGSAAGCRRPSTPRPPTAAARPRGTACPGSSVCAGRLPGSRTFTLAGSRENDAPRFWKWTPVAGIEDAATRSPRRSTG